MTDSSNVHQHVSHGDITEHYVNGEHISTLFKNAFGGYDINHGTHLVARTEPNLFDGVDIYVDGKLAHQTIPNLQGGTDSVHHGQVESSSVPNPHGGFDFYDHHGSHLYASTLPMGHSFTTVMQHSDPLSHAHGYHMDPLHL